jgi:hypothetical protein
MDYESFFYTFDDLPSHPTYAQIRRKIKPGSRRQHAFKHFADIYPDAIHYRLGYAESYAENGVYDDNHYQHCFDWINDSLKLPDSDGAHAKLRILLADLRDQQRELHDELGPDPKVERDPYDAAFRSGRYDVIEDKFASLQQSLKPCGIMGGDEERLFWRLFQITIRIAFRKQNPELAIQQFDRYEEMRIAVKLTPIPDYDLQEMILGYLAQQSLQVARSRLAYWLSNSRMPTINDTVKQHAAFQDLCNA